MKNWILFSTVLATMIVISCGKKDEAAAPPPPPCISPNVPAPGFGGQCLNRGQCPLGQAVSPSQPSMCVDIYTANVMGPQQCGAGFVLTSGGCVAQGPCGPGRALVGDTCKEGATTNGSYTQPIYGNTSNGNVWGAGSVWGRPYW